RRDPGPCPLPRPRRRAGRLARRAARHAARTPPRCGRGQPTGGGVAVRDRQLGPQPRRALRIRPPRMINFVSNLPRELRTGGFSAMSAAACDALQRRHEVAYVGPIDPPIVAWEKAVSKALRLSGLGGGFSAFSERRLKAIASEVDAQA